MEQSSKPKRRRKRRRPLHAIHAAIANLDKRMDDVKIAVRILDKLVK